MKKLSSGLFNAIKIIIGITLLVASLWGIDWNRIFSTISTIGITWLLLTIASVFISLGLKVLRWYLLLWDYGIQVSFVQTASSFFLGQASNIILPVRGGEVVRFGWLRSQKDRGAAEIVTTIGIEKVLDLMFFLVLSFLITAFIPIQEIQKNTVGLAISGAILTLVMVVAIWFMPGIWQSYRNNIQIKIPARVQSSFVRFDRWISECKLVRQPRYLLPIIAITFLTWVVMLATNLFLLKAFNLPILVVAGALVLVAIYVGVLPALMPGNIGPFIFFANLALAPFGFDPQVRVAYSILLQGIVTIPPLVLAGLFVIFSRLSVAHVGYQKTL
ncbi:MAG: lysylphosphatidylglycerol synthase transmembrane domain-containing protein [Anaerolineaceae bacterium]|nr:lysylphosphatidylglycerol synthase transmembrane domain-containing protein [Anaerolineaceae bacterium]